MVGLLVKEISGVAFHDFTRQEIFEPLSMLESYWFLDEMNGRVPSKLYSEENGTITEIEPYQLITYADGGLRTSISDLTKFFQCILQNGSSTNSQILSSILVHDMRSPKLGELQITDGLYNSGYFWELRRDNDGHLIEGHSGSDPGIHTMMYYDNDLDQGVILFVNTELNGFKSAKDIWSVLWRMEL